MKTLSPMLLCALGLLSGPVLLAEEGPILKLEIKDGVLAPQRLEAPAGKAFKLEIRNTGKVAAEFECKPLKKEKVVVAGAVAVISFTPAQAGDYKFVDEFHENQPQGQGVITVK
jgi:Cupredoxin-like domain